MKTDESMIVILRIHEKTCQRLSKPHDPLLPTLFVEIRSPGPLFPHCVALTVPKPL